MIAGEISAAEELRGNSSDVFDAKESLILQSDFAKASCDEGFLEYIFREEHHSSMPVAHPLNMGVGGNYDAGWLLDGVP